MKTITVTLPKIEDVQFEIEVEEDHIPVRGNALASGDDAEDKRVEDEIIARLENEDVWAWASVRMVATWRGLTADDYLGACCYKDEDDFKKDGYYEDMKNNAYNSLLRQITDLSKD